MKLFRTRRRRPQPGLRPTASSLAQLDALADNAVQLAQQIKQTVAELRDLDTRGTDEPTR